MIQFEKIDEVCLPPDAWEGPDFSRAAKFLKCSRALAPEASFLVLDNCFRSLFQPSSVSHVNFGLSP